MLSYLQMIPLYLKYGQQVTDIWNAAKTNDDFMVKVQKMLPMVAKAAHEMSGTFLPDVASTVQEIAAAALTFNTELVKYAQRACNQILDLKPPLDVDGMYGPKTTAAVKQLQKQLGLTPDGWFGKLTEAAVKKLKGESI